MPEHDDDETAAAQRADETEAAAARRAASPLHSIAYALCALDESTDPDYGNDNIAEWVYGQLIDDGHLRDPRAATVEGQVL